MPRHKHADLIHAYADGAEVQFKNIKGYWEDIKNPSWIPQLEYRIKKPRIVKREGWVNLYKSHSHSGWVTGCDVHTSKDDALRCAKAECMATVKIEWEETQ